MDNSSLFFLIAEHSFTRDKITLLKKINFGPKIEFKKIRKNIAKKKQKKHNKTPPKTKKNMAFLLLVFQATCRSNTGISTTLLRYYTVTLCRKLRF